MAGWASATLYDSTTFSQRIDNILRSPAVRHEIAGRLTDKLAEAGNQQAVNFRPAFELAVEGAIDTEAFRSIFRTAVASTHRSLLAGGEKGIDLSQAIGVISATLQLPDNAKPGQDESGSLGDSFASVTKRMADLHVWQIQGWIHTTWILGTFGGLAAGAVAVALASNRRRMVSRLGLVLVADGALIAGAVLAAQWYVGDQVSDANLAAAVRDSVGVWTGDLRSLGLWLAGYGVVLAAAAAAIEGRILTPARVSAAVGGWVDRRRATPSGPVVVGAAALTVGVVLIRYHSFWATAGVLVVGLWLAYLGAAELMSLVRRAVPTSADPTTGSQRRHRLGVVSGLTVVLLALVSAGLVVSTRGASQRAEAGAEQACNGSAALCDLPLNKVMIPATHNSMTSERYPGWMFAEHIRTMREQLDAGVRALLIDTHYGIPSAARMPGSQTQVIVTDRAHELVRPTGEQADSDPNIVARAQALAGQVPPSASAGRGVYLCHNWCELGAIRLSDGLAEVEKFLETHPDEVIVLDIEDHTNPADTSAVIEKSGLADRAWTLDPKAPLPTLGQMIAAKKNVLVLAEGGGPGAPPWYQPAYEHWVQETEYTWPTREDMDCRPKRGPADAPLFLFNHWVEAAPPNPKKARTVNERAFLEARLRRCFAERGQIPNIVAVDFSAIGDLISTVRDLNDAFVDQLSSVQRSRRRPPPPPRSGAPTSQPRPPTEPLTALPVSSRTEVTSLTGGDPTAFCDGWSNVEDVIGDWAEADLMALPSQEGLVDLAYGAAGAEALDAVADAAPAEVVSLLAPTRDRAHAAEGALRSLGVAEGTLDRDARAVIKDSAGGPESDGNTPEALTLVRTELLQTAYGADRVNATATAFAQAHPRPAGLFDLGDFTVEPARAAGFDCLLPPTP